MTTDALKFFQAYIKEMIDIGGENLPKTISAGLGANLAKIYKEKGISTIEAGLKESYSVLDAKTQVTKINDHTFENQKLFHCNGTLNKFASMTAICPGRCKFSELMPNHILSYINGNKFVTVMNCYRMTNKIRSYGRTSRPCLNDLIIAPSIKV